ncbi:ParB N-terminal domain-containing protein (plasmid) [Kovacikia minuta CCNUW1]|uniref:ParB/RepB/Spo0J family partition protein n=1 Tax=Kovacikia minuta TaxID=2931930 RepID=UPI001CCF697F|nr:ParB N-terminal domain-containing protein [Kovacikia minuta]UBF30407.1 ParB N-terminal domain-containing protein [Kovacikia minuta CCNUW1]
MTTRRKLKDAIASNEELSFVFGQSTAEKIVQTVEAVQEQMIPFRSILCTFSFVPDQKPVRHYYDAGELEQWALNDIQPNGIRSPLWVRSHPIVSGKYELVAGLRRLKAAEILGLEFLPAKIFDWDDRTAFHAAISENSNRRDFSALEELDNTLRLLEIQLGYDTDEVVSFLYRMNNATKGTTNQNVLVSEEAELVQQIFNAFGRITWQSFVATRLPLLKKPNDILDAIRQGKIQYTKGILIASVKDPDARQDLLEEVIEASLPLSEIKQRIKASNDGTQRPTGSAAKSVSLQQRLTQTVQMAKRNKSLWHDPSKTQQIEQVIGQLEAIVMS